jgi:hypothetical protein
MDPREDLSHLRFVLAGLLRQETGFDSRTVPVGCTVDIIADGDFL